jgi:PAS domain S-box-containing protein
VELSEYVLEPLGKEEELILFRGQRRNQGDAHSVLLLAPASTRPAPESLKRMEHEYSLRAELDPSWAVRPLALSQLNGQIMLVLENPGGEPLDRIIQGPMEMTKFLRFAVGLATALSQLHKRGLIHKDIKPPNVLVNSATGLVWLMGFGIASRLPREHQSPEPPEFIAGTLAYMAPEQTGRMNRSIDSRSDLYALGVTLYEMLTGRLPFTASDPMEWVHCHIARQPAPPSERLKNVPGSVSAIIVKLLAKTAEERYQTSVGAESDLRRCLAEWETQHRIDEFALGEDDTPDRLLIPEKLYGRESEIEALVAAFDRIVAGGRPELVLVSGYSGIGKSSVVNELHKPLVPPRGLIASGKFDQYKRDIPYATLAQAFQSLIRPLLSKSEKELSKWRDALREALDPNGQLIVDLVPELKLIIGEQSPVPELPPQDAKGRFQLVLRRFISVFTREHPLALFLDDLQWLDAATLDLMEDLLIRPDVQHLMLIGAYRDNEVNPTHPLMRKLEAIRQAGAMVQDIVLAPLAHEDLRQLVADSLHCEPERAKPLAQLIHEKTTGNPFFAIQFFSALAEENLLTFDHEERRWFWDLNSIRAKGYTDNVVDLMVGKLNRLPAETQKALQLLSCMGNSAEFALLKMVSQDSNEEMQDRLWEAVRAGLIFCTEHSYRFLHDRVQEAAYSLIPEESRAEVHLRIGRLLAANTPPEKQEEEIFEIVNQLNRGSHLITSQEERERIAELNLVAGRRAKISTAYASALKYLAAGRALLTEQSWDHNYELIFAIEFHLAECELLTANMVAAEDRLSMLARRAKTVRDIAAVARLRLTLYTTLDRSDRGVEVCLEYLQRGGARWSPHPTSDEVRSEYDRIWSRIGSRSIEELIDLPLMNDPDSLAALDVLTEMVTPALFTDENLVSLVICRMVNLSLDHGNSDGSCFAYVWLGIIAGPRFGNYKAGFRFGQLGYELVEKRGLKRFQARTYMSFGNIVMPWTKHIRTGRDLVRRAIDAANKIGDLTFAAYSPVHLNTNLLAVGDPLVEAQREAENGLEFAQKARFGLVIDIITAQIGLIRTLRGLTPQFGSFNDERFDELRFERHLSGDPVLALPECWYWIRKLQARFFAGDYASAIDAASRAQRLLWTSPSLFETAEYEFYGALSRAASCDSATPDRRQQHVEVLAAHHRQLEIWAENCPENFENRAALVSAEIARIQGRELEAEHFYEQAIRSAHENGFAHNEAMANELAAHFYAARGFEKIAHTYLQDARYGYLRWGADGKVRQLDQLYPHLWEKERVSSPSSTIGAPVEQLDLATVIKVSQAVSGEIVLEKLIDTLMRTAIEHAGAERGLLILPRGVEQRIEAEATTSGDTVIVRLQDVSAAGAGLPESIVHYVVRTRESVILNDASAQNSFSTDTYLRQRRARSVLCLPLINQARLIGVLYLENNLTPHVFNPARIAALELLASQAAISLENASLYSDLQRSEAFLAQGQTLSHTGSFGRSVLSGEMYWSEETYKIFEHDRVAKPTLEWIMQRIHPDDRDRVQQIIDDASQESADLDFEHRLMMPDGSVKYLHVLGRALKTSAENLEFVGAVTDVTAAKQAEEELRHREAELLEAQRLSHTGSWKHDIASGQVTVSPEVYRIYGVEPDEVKSNTEFWLNRNHPEDAKHIQELFEACEIQKTNYEANYRIVLPDGSVKHLHAIGHPIVNEKGGLVEFVGTVMDVTEQHEARAALQTAFEQLTAEETELRRMADAIASYVYVLRPDGTALYANQTVLDYTGLTLEDVQRADLRAGVLYPEDVERLREERHEALARGKPFEIEQRELGKDGNYRWFLVRYNPLRDDHGNIIRWYATGTDIEDRKRAEERMREENLALREQIDQAFMFEEIVGSSPALQTVLSSIVKVAPTDSTVLITGETGTGKELIARAIHKHSQRSGQAFVSVNCASIPSSLSASELFGHEKGAFTGAVQRRQGRFELAHSGTIFLDEVGDLPAETQITLLRVLQERQFERVGGNRTLTTDVRVIAATNRDLTAAVAAGTFRSDLFYRLNVFPIEVPPLRKRKKDIPMLVEYFVKRYAEKAGKQIRKIDVNTLELCQSYPWPGNIRELQNIVERSVILTSGDTLSIEKAWLANPEPARQELASPLPDTLQNQERELIETALAECKGKVAGPQGAAAKLGIPRSTLDSKIKQLKIKKHKFISE